MLYFLFLKLLAILVVAEAACIFAALLAPETYFIFISNRLLSSGSENIAFACFNLIYKKKNKNEVDYKETKTDNDMIDHYTDIKPKKEKVKSGKHSN